MNRRHLLPLIFILLSCVRLSAQSDSIRFERDEPTTATGIIAGYHGFGYHYLELGIARSEMSGKRMRGFGYGVSGMLRLGGESTIVGGSLSAWSNGSVGLGINLDYFAGSQDGSTLRLRPDVGVMIGRTRITYGYSILIAGGGFNGVNKHDFSLRLFLPW